MRIKELSLFVIGAVFAGFVSLQIPIYGQKTAPVVVTNTAANPVPVAGGVVITNVPSVDAYSRQSGEWSVGLTGTPTVRIDPEREVVVRRPDSLLNAETYNWTGQDRHFFFQSSLRLSQARVCVHHQATNPIQIVVRSVIGTGDDGIFDIDNYQINSPSTVCKVYEAPGQYIYVYANNLGLLNTSGRVRFGFVGIY